MSREIDQLTERSALHNFVVSLCKMGIGRGGSLHNWWGDPFSYRGPLILYRSTWHRVFFDLPQSPTSDKTSTKPSWVPLSGFYHPFLTPFGTVPTRVRGGWTPDHPLESVKTGSDKNRIGGGPTTLTPKEGCIWMREGTLSNRPLSDLLKVT